MSNLAECHFFKLGTLPVSWIYKIRFNSASNEGEHLLCFPRIGFFPEWWGNTIFFIFTIVKSIIFVIFFIFTIVKSIIFVIFFIFTIVKSIIFVIFFIFTIVKSIIFCGPRTKGNSYLFTGRFWGGMPTFNTLSMTNKYGQLL